MPKRLPGTISAETYRKRLDHKLDRISYFIVMNGPSNKKTLERRLKIDKPTIYKAIRRLIDTKRIVIHHREMSGMVKYYDLTNLGLMHVVMFGYEEANEDASKISDLVKRIFVRNPEWLPDIASLWPAIEEVSREERDEDAFTSLEALALYALTSIAETAIADALHHRDIQRDDPSSHLLLSWLYPRMDEEYGPRWIKAMKENSVLREATTRKLHEKIRDLGHIVQAISK